MYTPPVPFFSAITQDARRNHKAIGILFLLVLITIPAGLLVVMGRLENRRGFRVGDTFPAMRISEDNPLDSLFDGFGTRGCALFFFSADCHHCQRQVASINEAEKQFFPRVNIVAITRSGQDRVRSFVAEFGLSTRIVIDEKGCAANLFGVYELPTLVLLNRERKIEWIGTGEHPRGEIMRRLSALCE